MLEGAQVSRYLAAAQIGILVKHDNMAQLWANAAQRDGRVQLRLFADEQYANVSVVDDEGRLRRRIGGIERHADAAQVENREIGQRPGHAVIGENADALLHFGPQGQQPGGNAIDANGGLFPGQLKLAVGRPLAKSCAIGSVGDLMLYTMDQMVLQQISDHSALSLK
ncbi:Uncharacterised protein [Acinetobacter baumannii]|nr:Uncharacterised protein [Acinetobacter baumannii]